MGIKYLLQRLAEKLTGRKCSRCYYNYTGRCYHPDSEMYMRCWPGITRPGYTGRFERVEPAEDKPGHEGKYLDYNGWGMSAEEENQLQKIKAALQEAEDTARDGGLMGE